MIIVFNSYIIKPLDRMMCNFLEKLLKYVSKIYNFFKYIFKKIIYFFIFLKDNWFIHYRPKFKNIIIYFKIIKYYRFNWFKYCSNLIKIFIKCIYLINILINRWLWSYYFSIYFFNIKMLKKYLLIKYFFILLIYKSYNIKVTLYFTIKKVKFIFSNFCSLLKLNIFFYIKRYFWFYYFLKWKKNIITVYNNIFFSLFINQIINKYIFLINLKKIHNQIIDNHVFFLNYNLYQKIYLFIKYKGYEYIYFFYILYFKYILINYLK